MLCASSSVGSATAKRRSRRRSRCGSPARSTPDACEPLFAALIARGRSVRRRSPRALPARERERQRAARAGDRGEPAAAPTGSPSASSRASTRDPRGALAQGGVRVEAASRPRARALRARARGAQATCRCRARRLGQVRAIAAGTPIGCTATRGSRSTRRASTRPTRTLVPRGRRDAAFRRSSTRGACVRRCARDPGRDVLAAIDAMPTRAAGRGGVALLARARASWRSARRDEAKRAVRNARQRVPFLRDARRRSARSRSSSPPASPSTPTPEALAAFGARADVRRAVKLAAARHAPGVACASGRRSCAASTTKRCSSRPNSRGARACTTARSTPPSARVVRHDFALRYLMPYRERIRGGRARARRRRRAAVRHRAPGVALHSRHRVVGRRAWA